MTVLTAVQVAFGIAADGPGAAFGVGEGEGALKGTLDRVGVAAEEGVHGRVAGNVGAQGGEGVELGLAVT